MVDTTYLCVTPVRILVMHLVLHKSSLLHIPSDGQQHSTDLGIPNPTQEIETVLGASAKKAMTLCGRWMQWVRLKSR